jgi:long-chain acyl-CoA synthetase
VTPTASPNTLVGTFRRRAAAHPERVAYDVFAKGATRGEPLTWGAWVRSSEALAALLIERGVVPGDRVMIHAGNRPLWPIADLAIGMVQGVSVGVYPTSAPVQVRTMVADCQPRVVIVDSLRRRDLVQAIRTGQASTFDVICDAPGADHEQSGGALELARAIDDGRALLDAGAMRDRLDERMARVGADDLAMLIYTSGSTGQPKGACISHRYLSASARSIAEVLGFGEEDSSLSFLPFSHAAERVFGLYTRIHAGMTAALIEDPADLFHVAARQAPTVFGGLPRLFERLYDAAERARQAGGDPAAAIVERLGNRCRIATSGGAALPGHVASALSAYGLPVVGAYGQTEHLCIAMNRPDALRFDAVGPPMPGTEVRLAGDGEVQVRRSDLTFSGYYNRPDETRAAFTADGDWLRTGDRGVWLEDGALRIIGRLTGLIALSTGRKIAPAPIEAALAGSALIEQAFCYGEGRRYLTAVVALRRSAAEAWAHGHRIDTPWPELVTEPALRDAVLEAVAAVNETLAGTDQVKDVLITTDNFSVAAGELTPTLKPVRRVIEAKYLERLEALYQ